MPKQVKRLTWKDGQYSTTEGFAGRGQGVRLFAITWKSRREAPNWLMRCDLPGFTGQEWKDNDKDVLKSRAEAILASWLESVGSAVS
jgi:hypothetical protein